MSLKCNLVRDYHCLPTPVDLGDAVNLVYTSLITGNAIVIGLKGMMYGQIDTNFYNIENQNLLLYDQETDFTETILNARELARVDGYAPPTIYILPGDYIFRSAPDDLNDLHFIGLGEVNRVFYERTAMPVTFIFEGLTDEEKDNGILGPLNNTIIENIGFYSNESSIINLDLATIFKNCHFGENIKMRVQNECGTLDHCTFYPLNDEGVYQFLYTAERSDATIFTGVTIKNCYFNKSVLFDSSAQIQGWRFVGNYFDGDLYDNLKTLIVRGEASGSTFEQNAQLVSLNPRQYSWENLSTNEERIEWNITNNYLKKYGDTMTGSLILKSDPTKDLEAATKQYVDNHISTITAMAYEGLPEKPSTPIADGQEIPYTWKEINAITLAGKAQEYFSLGSTKLVNLSTPVLGANAATMMIIGFDQDGENTTTFQTKGVLPTTTAFGSDAVWIGSIARTQCQNFYNACEAKDFIKTVSKGTCPSTNNSRSGTATYNDETVWLPSEREMGLDSYAPLSTANSTTSNAECTKGYNAAYSYYTSNTTRGKHQMNANGTLTTSTVYYWERSHRYIDSTGVCVVNTNGSASSGTYSSRGGFAPAFVIGNGTFSAKIVQDGEDITDKVKGLVGGPKVGNITTNVTLLDVAVGTVLTFKENGVDTNFVKIQDNYEGSGRVAMIRQTPLTTTSAFNQTNGATYSYGGSILDTWLNETYLTLLDDSIKNLIKPVNIPINQYTGSAWTKTTISRYCFAPSYREYGYTGSTNIADGTEISQLEILSQNFNTSTWMRTLHNTTQAYYFYSSNSSSYASVANTFAVWPMFTLPADYEIRSYSIPTFVDADNNDISNIFANASKKQFIKEIITSEEATAIQIDVSDINFDAYDEIIMYTDLQNGKHTSNVSPYCSITINEDTSSIYGNIGGWPNSSQNMANTYIAYPGIISDGSYYNCFTPIIRFVTRGASTFCQVYYGYHRINSKSYYIALSSGVYPSSLVSTITITVGNTSNNSIAAGSEIRIWGTRK